ncbi:YceI family protein [Flavobacterium oreochromis]|uniref:YceI family protein n=1 Tax=Flavobacterium oreochromis TaxID=2906078 RepID=UPI0038581DB0
MKSLFYSLFLFINIHSWTQEKNIAKNGIVTFEASVATFEEVKATTSTAVCVLNSKTGDLASAISIKTFKFKNSLMQEHFNENYMESDKFPKAIFKGKIENYNSYNFDNQTKIQINGTFEIHGKSKNMTVPATLKKEGNNYILVANFVLKPEEFNIEIPSIVGYKIAKSIEVSTTFKLLAL